MRKTIRRVSIALLCVLMLATSALSVIAAPTYNDVKTDDWYYEFVTYMSGKGIINGYPSDNTFRPNNYVKRAEFIKMMILTFGLTDETAVSYTDVKDHWSYEYYRKAAAQGFLTEVFTSKTVMDPEKYLTREEAAALLMAYMSYAEDEKASESYFADY
ncbi:MAG: S-layer homology domain-containing protein, partial [Clostridia bacterium]|nr:S-layer homology domain-containing protein [Clostridia bacterium]